MDNEKLESLLNDKKEGDNETKEDNVETDQVDLQDNSSKDDDPADDSVDNKVPYNRFKDKVDEVNALKAKLDAYETAKEEDERKELEAKEQYKILYEQELEKNKLAQEKVLMMEKSSLLRSNGYSDEQSKLLVELVKGDTEEEINESIKTLKATIPAQDEFTDPSSFNTTKKTPTPTDKEEVGRNAVSRVLHKIKL